jgi:ribosomal protein L17
MSTATYAVRRNQNLYRPKASLHLGPVSVSFLTVAAVSVLALLYLTQITKTNIYGYKVSDLTVKRDKIQTAEQDLEVEAARLQAIQQIQASPVVAKLVPETAPVFASR